MGDIGYQIAEIREHASRKICRLILENGAAYIRNALPPLYASPRDWLDCACFIILLPTPSNVVIAI